MKMTNSTNIRSLEAQRSKKHSEKRQINETLDDACGWIAKIDRDLTIKEKHILSQWLSESPGNAVALMEVAQLWDKMDDLNRLADLFPKSTTVYRGLQISKKWASALVASFALFISVSVLMFSGKNEISGSSLAQNSETKLVTNIGESRTVELSDGSKLVLNTNTLAEVQFTDKARIIELTRGEIHIDVAHDKSRPLSVVVAGKVIQAVGTAFNVEVQNDLVELIVTDGKVLVADIVKEKDSPLDLEEIIGFLPTSSRAISKGEKISLASQYQSLDFDFEEEVIAVEPIDIAASLSWRTGNLIFRGEPLSVAIMEIGRYSDMNFVLEDNEKLKNIRVAGMFKTGDIPGLLNVLEQNFKIKHREISGNTIYLNLPETY